MHVVAEDTPEAVRIRETALFGDLLNRWKFGFPVFYVTDLLQNVEALIALGYGDDPRLSNALTVSLEKRDVQGRWALDYGCSGKTWVDLGAKKQPSKWVTLRALRALTAVA